MSLSDFRPERRLIKFKTGSFEVKGLGLDDLSVLIHDHLVDLDKLMGVYSDNDEVGSAALVSFAISLTREAPALVALVIALGAGDRSLVDRARDLPLAIQIGAIRAIGELTFEELGGVKKVGESLREFLVKVAPHQETMDSPT